MKFAFSAFLVCAFSTVFGQIEITSGHLPDADDVLIQYPAIFPGDVDLEFSGPDFTWEFGEDVIQLTGLSQNTQCYDIDNTPLAFQFLFNNPFDPEHNSDFGIGVESFDLAGFVTIENAYQYYQNRSDRYAITGFAASLNNIPAGAVSNPVDVIYELPLNYADAHTSHSETSLEVPTLFAYHQELDRSSIVDGWGTLNILGESYEVLRVRQEVTGSDSVYVELLGNGFLLERPLSVIYTWLSTEFKTPVLEATSTNGMITDVRVADIPSVVRGKKDEPRLTVYPVPACDRITIAGNTSAENRYEIFDISGRICSTGKMNQNTVEVSGLTEGNYVIRIVEKDRATTAKFTVAR